jgi:mRNA interferase MazF
MYTQGDIWLANLEPAKFGEVGKVRPVVIVQEDTFDLIELKSTIIVPISSTPQGKDFTLLRIKN